MVSEAAAESILTFLAGFFAGLGILAVVCVIVLAFWVSRK